MSTAWAVVEDRSAFIGTSQLCLSKSHLLCRTIRAGHICALGRALEVFRGQDLSVRRQLVPKF